MKLLSNVDLEAAFEERGLGSMFRELKLGQYIPSKKEFKQAGAMDRAGYSALFRRCGLENTLPKERLSLEIVQTRWNDLAKSISKNFALLGGILDRHEATIHRRWSKKYKPKKMRSELICEAWGAKMASSHRPDFEALEREVELQRIEGTKYRDSYL